MQPVSFPDAAAKIYLRELQCALAGLEKGIGNSK